MWTVENAVMTTWVSVALGLLLLFLGRKLFWVFVGVFGFLAGVQIAAGGAQGQPDLDDGCGRRRGRTGTNRTRAAERDLTWVILSLVGFIEPRIAKGRVRAPSVADAED